MENCIVGMIISYIMLELIWS